MFAWQKSFNFSINCLHVYTLFCVAKIIETDCMRVRILKFKWYLDWTPAIMIKSSVFQTRSAALIAFAFDKFSRKSNLFLLDGKLYFLSSTKWKEISKQQQCMRKYLKYFLSLPLFSARLNLLRALMQTHSAQSLNVCICRSFNAHSISLASHSKILYLSNNNRSSCAADV
jgi:hypothetical protein